MGRPPQGCTRAERGAGGGGCGVVSGRERGRSLWDNPARGFAFESRGRRESWPRGCALLPVAGPSHPCSVRGGGRSSLTTSPLAFNSLCRPGLLKSLRSDSLDEAPTWVSHSSSKSHLKCLREDFLQEWAIQRLHMRPLSLRSEGPSQKVKPDHLGKQLPLMLAGLFRVLST